MVNAANRKMMVRPASRILSAISFGVFCRSAPSTSLIMRSMKVDPCAAVIRTRIQSDSTCVPRVPAERSPPDSRITGADSPVIAASLTEAMPSTTSPSEGIKSPASTRTTSPTLRFVLGNGLGKVGEQHREPQPKDNLKLKTYLGPAGHQIADQDDRGQRGDDFEHE